VLAQQASINRDVRIRREQYSPNEFNPYYKPPQPKVLTDEDFAAVFGD
jgi:hypothetical protein